jgi:eukaryotic-like serine/threonine-protein kinase
MKDSMISMKSDSDREVAIFTKALKVPPEERDAFLDRMCNGDEDLRRRVEAILRAHDRLGSFLEEPPAPGPVD